MRDDRLYDVCLVLDWNLPPFGRKRNGGSAIFLHVARPGFPPTEGCIAVAPETMRALLPRIGFPRRIAQKTACLLDAEGSR
jgi:L,D-peptidoglycan transpeptidase YkuD (ErfK/YbiS/YcfS/YnhG family)